MRQYCICMNEDPQVKRAQEFCKGYCYRSILNHGRKIAQIEVCETVGGFLLVDVTPMRENLINETIKVLRKMGFSGKAKLFEEYENTLDEIITL